MGDDDDEESDDGLSAPWKVVRQQLVAEAEEDTLQAEARENATTAATGADEDTLDANVPTVSFRGRRPFSPSYVNTFLLLIPLNFLCISGTVLQE